MKETVKTSRTAGYLEKIFRTLNAYYFGNEIEEPVITIQSTPKAYGHVTVGKTWTKGPNGELRRELNIGAGTLARPIENVVATMLHEMVHLKNLQDNIQDCSRGGAYHNKRFKELAEKVDLSVSHDTKYGWTITEPTEALMEFILEQGWSEISMNRNEGLTFTGIPVKGPSPGALTKTPGIKGNSRKLECPGCHNSVRATKKVNIICADCMQMMIEV